jgi:hypothetical protein
MKHTLGTEVKQFWQWLVQFIKQPEIPSTFWLVWLGYLGLLIGANYAFDFENEVLDTLTPQPLLLLGYFIFYFVAFAGTVLIQRLFYLKINFPLAFWASLSWVLLVKVLNGNAVVYNYWVENSVPWELQYFARRCLSNFSRATIAFAGAGLSVLMFAPNQTKDFFGLFSTGKSLKPYWLMLGIMLPLVVLASFQADFLSYYPRYQATEAAEYLQVPQWVTTLTYEFCYGTDFVAVELLFRGMMIWIIGRYMGIHVVFPMATVYCMIHFGKPLGETISSIIGGTILGVIAYNSRSILGGVFIHLGIAWLMEIVAGVQHAFR